jgi:hypothetical protein
LDESFEKKNLKKVNIADDFDEEEEVLPTKTKQCEILDIKNDIQEMKDQQEMINSQCEEIRNKMRYTTIS